MKPDQAELQETDKMVIEDPLMTFRKYIDEVQQGARKYLPVRLEKNLK